MTEAPRPAHCCWLPSLTSRLSSHSHTARQVTALRLSPPALDQPERSASPGRSNSRQGPRLAMQVLEPQCTTHKTQCGYDFDVFDVASRSCCHIQCVESSSHVLLLLLLLLLVDVQWEIAFNDNTASSCLTSSISQNYADCCLFDTSHQQKSQSKHPEKGNHRTKGITGEDHWTSSLCA